MARFNLKEKSTQRRVIAVAVALFALLVMGFYSATDPERLASSGLLSGADWMGYGVCHRITSHSFVFNGRQLPLCARCTGMYLGAALTFITLLLADRSRWSDLPPMRVLAALLVLVGLMGVDGLNSYSHFFPNTPHLYEPQNWLRLLTGLGTGIMMGSVMFPALAQTLWKNQIYRPSIQSLRELAGMVLIVLTAWLLIMSNQPTITFVLAVISVAGLLMLLASINLVIGLIIIRKDGKMESWRETAVPLLIGLTLAIVELSLISMLRYNFTGTMTGFPGLN